MSEAELHNSYVEVSEVRGMNRTVLGLAAELKKSRSYELESVRLPSTAKDWFVCFERAAKKRTIFCSMV